MKYKNIAIVAAKNNQDAIAKKDFLVQKYNFKDLTFNHLQIQGIDLVIAVGGDGLMLHLLHEYEKTTLPIYGVNCGTVGFLLNSFCEKNFLEILEKSQESILNPLRMNVVDMDNNKHSHIAINEVSLLRQSSQAAKIRILVNNQKRMECLMSDGILLATSAGSTAYNLSVGGPIIPIGTKILALTPISPFRPRNWKGALLPEDSVVSFEVIDYKNRPVSAMADSKEVKNIKEVSIAKDCSINFRILFDLNHSLEERIFQEQFE